MLPILFSFGPISIRSFYVFSLLAFFLAGFVFWRKGKEEYYDENVLFDGFILTMIFTLLSSRLGYILMHLPDLGSSVVSWFDLMSHPGLNGLFGGIGGTLFLYRYAIKQKWDAFEVLDFWATCLSICLGVIWLGLFFDGTGFGFATSLPWGVIFPEVFEKHHPVQIYASFFYFVLYFYLLKLEYQYRTFSWYINKRKNAQTGFIFSIFLISLGLIELALAFLTPSELIIQGINLDWAIAMLTSLFGVLILLSRAGYLPSLKKK